MIQPWPSVGQIYAQVAARHGFTNVSPDLLNRQFSAAWAAKKAFDHSPNAWLDLVARTFAGSLDKSEVQKMFNSLYDQFAAPEVWRVFDEVHSTLTALGKRAFRLGIISNWDERLRPLLERLQLSGYFQVVAISIEIGSAKPFPEIFNRAASLLNLPPSAILHIGDSWQEDVIGAQAAGFQALLLNRNAATRGPQGIRTLDEMLPLIVKNVSDAEAQA